MELTQNWVGRLDRSYQQIKASLLNKLVAQAPEITDHSESNPLVVIVDMFAGVGEVLNLYIDSWSREAFWGVARRYTSLVKLSRLIDYQIKAKGYATSNQLFSLHDNLDLPTTHTTAIVIPRGTIITPNTSSLTFVLLNDVIIPAGHSSAYGDVAQYTEVNNLIIGNTNGLANQRIALSPDYVHDTLRIKIAGVDWQRYNSFGWMSAATKGFVVEIDENQDIFLVFGDGINGAIPQQNQVVTASYFETSGVAGNLFPNSITNITTPVALPVGITLKTTNPDYSSGGSDIENLEEIRTRAPRSLRTLDRAVTYQDYIDVALQVVGVSAAEVSYCCGKYVDLYIVPKGRGVSTQALISKVSDWMDCRKMITTMVDVKPAGITRVWIKAKVIGKPFATAAQLETLTLAALDLEYGQGTAKINRRVSVTDIVATLEAIPEVDTAEVEKIQIEPYARPLEETTNVLNLEFIGLPLGTQSFPYKVIYKQASGDFEVYKSGIFIGTADIGVNFVDAGVTTFKINAGVYADNDTWEFTTFPSYPEIFPNTIINITDYSAAIVDVSPLIDEATPRTIFSQLTYETTQATSNCLPPC